MLADIYNYSYQPALSRHEIVKQKGPSHLIRSIISTDRSNVDENSVLCQKDAFLNAMIMLADSEPKELVKHAVVLGNSLSNLRNYLNPEKIEENLVLDDFTDRARLMKRLQTAIRKVVQNDAVGQADKAITDFMPGIEALLCFGLLEESNSETSWVKLSENCGFKRQ